MRQPIKGLFFTTGFMVQSGQDTPFGRSVKKWRGWFEWSGFMCGYVGLEIGIELLMLSKSWVSVWLLASWRTEHPGIDVEAPLGGLFHQSCPRRRLCVDQRGPIRFNLFLSVIDAGFERAICWGIPPLIFDSLDAAIRSNSFCLCLFILRPPSYGYAWLF